MSNHSHLLYIPQLHSIMTSLTLYESAPEKTCLFSNLPCELVTMVFENLSDFGTLLATILTCKWSMRFFQDDQNAGKIFHSVFSNILCTASRYDHEGNTEESSILIFRQMNLAAQKVLIPRRHVLSVFGECWQFLERRNFEELLIPTGRRLALSLVSKGYKSKAVEFLGMIESGNYGETKDISDNKRLALLPLVELKASLQGKPLESLDPRYEDFKELPLAIVRPDRILYSSNKTQWHRDISVQEEWVVRISELPQIIRPLPQQLPRKTKAEKQKVRIERHQRQRRAEHFQKKLLLSGANMDRIHIHYSRWPVTWE